MVDRNDAAPAAVAPSRTWDHAISNVVLRQATENGERSPLEIALERVTAAMRRAHPLAQEPVDVLDRPSEASELAVAFNAMAERLEDERRDSTRRALGAQEGERLRIARELHDEIGQKLTALLLRLTSARRLAGPDVEPILLQAHGLARESLDDARRVARELRPEALEDLGLPSGLAALAERLARQGDLRVEHQLQPVLPPLTAEKELVLYRVAQEALTNVLRHAGCERADLRCGSPTARSCSTSRIKGRALIPER